MRRTPWILTAVNAILLGLAALANFIKSTNDAYEWHGPFGPFAAWVKSQPDIWIFAATLLVVCVQVLKDLVAIHQYRKDRAQKVLQNVVKNLLGNDVRDNRCTLFKAVRGYRAWLHIAWRTLWWQDDKAAIFSVMKRIDPTGFYLYVYARPAGAKNERSCALYRVYRTREGVSEGVAGQVWENGEHLVIDAPAFAPGELKKVKELESYDLSDKVRQYADATNVKDSCQLRARERYARHFYGTLIESQDGKRLWGVLLVDSFKPTCPFPTDLDQKGKRTTKDKIFFERFRGYAETLSILFT